MQPDEVLLEAWRPLVFTAHTTSGHNVLAYLADESEDGDWYFLAPIADAKLSELRTGALSIRDALTNSWMWQCLDDAVGVTLWSVEPTDVPDIFLPVPGTPLLPEQDAMLITRAVGDRVQLGRIPSSVISFVTEATRGAVKVLLDYVSDANNAGRPPQQYREVYDLPVQRFAFNSFEVAFGAPDIGALPNDSLTTAIKCLEKGLTWASSSDAVSLDEDSTEMRAAIMRAALLLTPPSGGAISEVNVSGQWMNHKVIRLGVNSRKKVKAELRALKADRIVLKTGKIREVDRDLFLLTLRDGESTIDRKCFFADDLLDDVLQYFTDETTVTVSGMESSGRFVISLISEDDEQNAPATIVPGYGVPT